MIGPGRRIEPDNQIVRAVLLRFLRCGEVRQRLSGGRGDDKARQRHQSHRNRRTIATGIDRRLHLGGEFGRIIGTRAYDAYRFRSSVSR
jgi:hypothetical protein